MQISLNYSETKIPLSFYANFIRFFFSPFISTSFTFQPQSKKIH